MVQLFKLILELRRAQCKAFMGGVADLLGISR